MKGYTPIEANVDELRWIIRNRLKSALDAFDSSFGAPDASDAFQFKCDLERCIWLYQRLAEQK